MIVGYHVIFSAYGFWLPNDPRGSWSDFVGSWDLFRYGPATKSTERRSLAYDAHDRAKRLEAKSALKYPPVIFDGLQARGEWKVYLDPEDVGRAVRYVENNPIKEGKKKQGWSFVRAYR